MVEAVSTERNFEIKATGQLTKISILYMDRVCYRYNCLWNTTLGPVILEALTSSCISIINRLRPINVFLHKSILALLIIHLSVDIAYAENAASRDGVVIVTGINCGIMSIMFALNFLVWIIVGFPLNLAWMVGLVFFADTDSPIGSMTNEFFQVTYGEKLQYLNTDLSTYAFAAQLEREASIKLMIYNKVWRNRYIRVNSIVQPLLIWIGFTLAFIYMLIDSTAVGGEWVAWFVALVVGLAYYIIFALIPLVWGILNLVLCCIPAYLAARLKDKICHTVLDRMQLHKSAPQLEYN